MIDKKEIQEKIVKSLSDLQKAGLVEYDHIDEKSILYAKDGILSSIALVALLSDLEEGFLQEFKANLDLSSREAFSRFKSPFKSLDSLVDFVFERAKHENA